jgi:hypothetical protein
MNVSEKGIVFGCDERVIIIIVVPLLCGAGSDFNRTRGGAVP